MIRTDPLTTAAEAIRSFLQPFVTNTTIQPASIAAILARHFPSPPPVQEFAALAAAAEKATAGIWRVDRSGMVKSLAPELHHHAKHLISDPVIGDGTPQQPEYFGGTVLAGYVTEADLEYIAAASPATISALIAALGRERADKLVFAKCLENVASVAMALSNYYWNGRTDRHEPLPERSAEHVAHWWKKLGEAFDSCTSKGSQLQCDILHKARQVVAVAAVTSENSQNSFRKED